MKYLLIIFINTLLFVSSCSDKYKMLSIKNSNTENLLKSIKPNHPIQYWQIDYISLLQPKKIYTNGNINLVSKIPLPQQNTNGFFIGCEPMQCSYRILYIENNKWHYVNDEESLKKFIGDIDNESEAFLIGKINGYRIDDKSEKGNGFIINNQRFKIKMMKYNNCPQSKESFKLTINKSGNIIKTKSNGFYFKSKDCIIY